MGETPSTFHPVAKFLNSCESKTKDFMCFQIQCWDRYRIDILITKGRNRKEERGNKVPNKSKNYIDNFTGF